MSRLLLILIAACLILTGAAWAQDATQIDNTNDTVAVATAAGETLVDQNSIYPLSPERHEKLVDYSKFKNIWRFVSFLAGLLTLGILLFTKLSARFRNWTSRIKPRFFAVWAFMAILMIADYLLTLPLSIYRGFVVESDYGFLNQSFWEWWSDDLLGLFIGLVIGIIPMWFFYWLVAKSKKWWLQFSLGAIPFIVFMVIIAPVVISPMFNEFTPLEDKSLEKEILTLADQAGIEGADVFQVDGSKQSNKINAYVTGLFGTKRIVLYDTIIESMTRNELRFVMAHEMGHYVMNHVWYGVLVMILFMLFALWLTDKTIHGVITRFRGRFGFDKLSDVASLPLVLIFASVISFAFQPVTNGFSRYIEHASDEYGMEMAAVSGEDAAIAFDKLAAYNLSDPDPHPLVEFWFYNHPALKKRMEFVRSWGE